MEALTAASPPFLSSPPPLLPLASDPLPPHPLVLPPSPQLLAQIAEETSKHEGALALVALGGTLVSCALCLILILVCQRARRLETAYQRADQLLRAHSEIEKLDPSAAEEEEEEEEEEALAR
ncbi:hypothetical protein AB1Y20_002355 [Prymnesium parvum]|uniref:Uncharacterized protein n=1 Tax=Prymnesium parvum TaxID=97485 RepID=A0AB34JB27_PRYPA